jgi:hypothetical protein
LLLPEVLIEYVELTAHKNEGEEHHFYFKEKNEQPKKWLLFPKKNGAHLSVNKTAFSHGGQIKSTIDQYVFIR